MELILGALSALAFIVILLLLYSLQKSLRKDRMAADAAHEAERKKAAEAEREAKLYREQEPLRCLGCEESFIGPLTDAGCPRCHSAALVMTEEEYQQKIEASSS